MCETVSVAAAEIEGSPDVATAVVSAMAAIDDVDPLALDFRLGDRIDPDALDDLFGHDYSRGNDVEVTFAIGDCDVVVEAPGTVVVSRPCDRPAQCSSQSNPRGCNA